MTVPDFLKKLAYFNPQRKAIAWRGWNFQVHPRFSNCKDFMHVGTISANWASRVSSFSWTKFALCCAEKANISLPVRQWDTQRFSFPARGQQRFFMTKIQSYTIISTFTWNDDAASKPIRIFLTGAANQQPSHRDYDAGLVIDFQWDADWDCNHDFLGPVVQDVLLSLRRTIPNQDIHLVGISRGAAAILDIAIASGGDIWQHAKTTTLISPYILHTQRPDAIAQLRRCCKEGLGAAKVSSVA